MAGSLPPETRRRILDAAMAAEQDPSPTLSVSDMAAFAGLSEKHFQRAFRSVLGETPKSYIRRIRLQAAAYLLKWSDMQVIDIAMEVGFETHAGFTKAFTRVYARSPQQFREAQCVVPYLRTPMVPDAHKPGRKVASEPLRLVVRIEEAPASRVAVMRHVGPVERCGEIWIAMSRWARERRLHTRSTIYLGIHNDYWDVVAEDRYRYDAGIVVPFDFTTDDEVNLLTIPGGKVAMTEFSGSLTDADHAWRRFVDQWLPISGYRARTNFAYDRYPADLIQAGPLRQFIMSRTGLRATLCLPIE